MYNKYTRKYGRMHSGWAVVRFVVTKFQWPKLISIFFKILTTSGLNLNSSRELCYASHNIAVRRKFSAREVGRVLAIYNVTMDLHELRLPYWLSSQLASNRRTTSTYGKRRSSRTFDIPKCFFSKRIHRATLTEYLLLIEIHFTSSSAAASRIRADRVTKIME